MPFQNVAIIERRYEFFPTIPKAPQTLSIARNDSGRKRSRPRMGGGGAGSVLQVRRNLPFETQAVKLVGEGAERERGAVISRSAQAVAVQKLPDAAGDGGRRVDDRDAAAREDTFEDGQQERIVRAAEHDLVGSVLQHLRDGGTDGGLGLGRRLKIVFDQFDEAPAGCRDEVYAVAVPGRRAAKEFAVEAPFGIREW